MRLGNALGIPEDIHRYEPDQRLVLSKSLIGLEFEFEGVKGEKPLRDVASNLSSKEGWAAYWKIKADGSLHDQGCEFLFARPLFGVDAIEAVKGLLEHARKQKYKVSIRTGLHVHVNVRDLTRAELAVLNVLYALFEKAVYRLAGNNRDENVFCMPWYKADAMSDHVNRINSDQHDIRVASEALENEKYGGLNLDTLARFGSVEWRHALATTDERWVLTWINVCLSFKRAAKKLNMQPLDIIHNLSGIGPDNLARIVFEDMYDVINYPQLVDDVWRTGVETALHVYPRQREIIDAAGFSWNKVKSAQEERINPRFKAFVDKQINRALRAAAIDPPVAVFNPNIFRNQLFADLDARAALQPAAFPEEFPELEDDDNVDNDDNLENNDDPV